jgi:hypothetical protein
MTTEDEALEATRAGLRAAGVALDDEGRVVPVSGILAEIAQAGGGVLDAETAVDLSVRTAAGEDAVLKIARLLTSTASAVRANPDLAIIIFAAFQQDAIALLSRAVPQFIYGLSTTEVSAAAAPLLAFRKAQEEEPVEKVHTFQDSLDEIAAPQAEDDEVGGTAASGGPVVSE